MSTRLSDIITVKPQFLDAGAWGTTTNWERHVTPDMPPEVLCSAAVCVAIKDDKVVLMRAERGWGMLGGHIEPGESVLDALRREALEEGGFVIDDYLFCGYRKMIASVPTPHPDPTREYPFPVSHIPFFVAVTTQPLQRATGVEVLETAAFTIDEVEAMNIRDWPVVKAVWDIYQQRRAI